MFLMLWVEDRGGWQPRARVEPVKLTIERERRPYPLHGRTPHVVAQVEGPDDLAEQAIRLLLLPAMSRALAEPWSGLPEDGAAAVAALVRRAYARPA